MRVQLSTGPESVISGLNPYVACSISEVSAQSVPNTKENKQHSNTFFLFWPIFIPFHFHFQNEHRYVDQI